MRKPVKNIIRRLVVFNKVTKFVAKLLGIISKFENGEYVQLKYDKSKKFYVVSNVIIEGKIQLAYFNSDKGTIVDDAYISPYDLEYSLEEMFRRYKEFQNRPDLEISI